MNSYPSTPKLTYRLQNMSVAMSRSLVSFILHLSLDQPYSSQAYIYLTPSPFLEIPATKLLTLVQIMDLIFNNLP